MSSESAVGLAITYVERVNRRDYDGLVELMPEDHRLDSGRTVYVGPRQAREAWSEYLLDWPDFQIHVSDVHVMGGTVFIVARTTGSCSRRPREIEIRERTIYEAKIEGGLVAGFRLCGRDTDDLRKSLGMTTETRYTE